MAIETEPRIVHYVTYSSQPDVQIVCTQGWTQPAWGERPQFGGVYHAENGMWYTFDRDQVTCLQCQQAYP